MCVSLRVCVCVCLRIYSNCAYVSVIQELWACWLTQTDSSVFQRWLGGPAPFPAKISFLVWSSSTPHPPFTHARTYLHTHAHTHIHTHSVSSHTSEPKPPTTSSSTLFSSCPSFNQFWPLTCWLKRPGVVTWCYSCLWPEIELLETVFKKKKVQKSRNGYVTAAKPDRITFYYRAETLFLQ